MVGMLSKVKESDGFHEVLDFLRTSHIAYALTINPKTYVEHINQFWINATVHGSAQNQTIQSVVHGKTIIISEALIRTHLQLGDESGIFSLSSETLFGGLHNMGYEGQLNKFTFLTAFFPPQGNFSSTRSSNVSLRKKLLGMSLAVQ